MVQSERWEIWQVWSSKIGKACKSLWLRQIVSFNQHITKTLQERIRWWIVFISPFCSFWRKISHADPPRRIPTNNSMPGDPQRNDSTSDWTFASLIVIVPFSWLLMLSHMDFSNWSGSVECGESASTASSQELPWRDAESWCISPTSMSWLILEDTGDEDTSSGVSRIKVCIWRL